MGLWRGLVVAVATVSVLLASASSPEGGQSICDSGCSMGPPSVVEGLIESPSPVTDLFHFIDHLTQSNHFKLSPRFMSSMPLDIAETPDLYTIHVDLPGVKKDNVSVVISPSQREMQISAHKESIKSDENQHFRRLERKTGHISRIIYLPEGADLEKMTAEFKHGVLQICLPKKVSKTEVATKLAIKFD